MGDDDHGHVLLGKLLDDLEHLAGQLGVERGGRLVKKEDLGLHRKGARDGDTLLLSAGKLAGVGVRFIGKTHLAQKLCRRLPDLLPVALLHVDGGIRHVFEHGAVREEVELLKHQPVVLLDPAQLRGGDVIRIAVLIRRDGGGAHITDAAGVDGLKECRTAQQR